ncbi:hypothetical protein LTS10_009801 [Elasticomyces elasticus]|nr:hypothetical protein LTS10_009801 [Elasticomyces elasticus]
MTLPAHGGHRAQSMLSLLDLPAELLVDVSKHADSKTLQALRLVNREIASAAIKEYIHRFFERRAHLFTAYGLEFLASITSSEHFVKHIKEITLIAPGLEGFVARNEASTAKYAPTAANKAKLDRRSRARQFLSKQHEAASQSGTYTAVLSQALINLRSAGVSPLFIVSDNIWSGEQCSGHQHLLRSFAEREEPPELGASLCEYVLPDVVKSIAATRFPLEKLSLSALSGLHLGAVGLPPGSEALFQHLKWLKLDIGISFSDFVNQDANVEMLSKFWTSAKDLQHLTISFALSWEDETWEEAADTLRRHAVVFGGCKNLRSITLESMIVPVLGLIDFLRPFAGTVERLYIHNMMIPDEDSYGMLFTFLHQCTELTELSIKNLEDENNRRLGYKGEVLEWWLRDVDVQKHRAPLMQHPEQPKGKKGPEAHLPPGEVRDGDIKETLALLCVSEDLEFHRNVAMYGKQKITKEQEEATEHENVADQSEDEDA